MVGVRRLAQGHLDTRLGGAGDRTSNLPVNDQRDEPLRSRQSSMERSPARLQSGGDPSNIHSAARFCPSVNPSLLRLPVLQAILWRNHHSKKVLWQKIAVRWRAWLYPIRGAPRFECERWKKALWVSSESVCPLSLVAWSRGLGATGRREDSICT